MIRRAELVGINAMDSFMALNTELNLQFIRRVNPEASVIMGGHHATFHAAEWLDRGAHAVVRHEGESTLAQLARVLADGGPLAAVKGISFLDPASGQIRHTADRPFVEDLDSLPLPAWGRLDFSPYRTFLPRRGWTAGPETSRGCRFGCRFCQVGPMWRFTRRCKSPGRVIEELKLLHRLGVRQLFLADDTFGQLDDAPRHDEIFRRWEAAGIPMEFGAFMRADYVLEHAELIERAAALGLRFAMVGFESHEQGWVEELGKGLAASCGVDSYEKVYRLLKRHGIAVGGYLIIGYPGQDRTYLAETLRAFPRFCDYPIVAMYKPLPGTRGYEQCKARGLLAKEMFYHDSQLAAVEGTREQLDAYNRYFLRFLLDPRRLAGALRPTDPGRGQMMRALYRWFAGGALAVNRHNAADFAAFLLHRGQAPAAAMARLTRKYLDGSFADRLASPFR
jgi:radical SAM superfamily enzyme YgiQ (UPF0313 family)